MAVDTDRQQERWRTENRLACALEGHWTARRSHETAWREPVSPSAQNPDFCHRCGETDVERAWPRWDRP